MKNKVLIYEFQDIRFASRARKEASSLAKIYDVELIGFNRELSKKRITKNDNLTIVEFPILYNNSRSFLTKVLNIFFTNFTIGRYIIKTKADIYLMHNLKLFYPSIIAKFVNGSKIVYDAHELHMAKRPNKTFKQKILTKYDILKEKYLIRISSLIIQASKQRAIYFSEFYRTKEPLVIENFANYVNLVNFEGLRIKDFLGLKDFNQIIIFTGFISIGGNQRIDKVIQSLVYLDKNVHFCVLGFGTDGIKEELKMIAQKHGVSTRFHFIPPVLSDEVVSYISQADVAVIPIYATSLNSRHSALNKVSQSLMAGLPLACSNYENLLEVAQNNNVGTVGQVFEVNQPESIAEAISMCLKHKNEYSKNALELAKYYFNWESQEDKLLSEFNKILK